MTIEDALNIYTDGSSFSRPRVGGIGIRFITTNELGDEVIEDVELPGYKGATNNQMELYAGVAALKESPAYYGHEIPVRAVFTRSERLKTLVDRAYREKYNTPGSRHFVRGFARKKRRDTTTELVSG
jgi:ribonuclease HI